MEYAVDAVSKEREIEIWWRWLVGLVIMSVVMSGCSGYRVVVLPDAECSEIDSSDMSGIYNGQTVRIALRSGDNLRGEIIDYNNMHIVIGYPSNYGFQELVVPYSAINKIEVEQSSYTESTILSVSIIAGILAVGAAVVIGLSISGVGP